MSSKLKCGAKKRRLKEKELLEKAGTHPKQKKTMVICKKDVFCINMIKSIIINIFYTLLTV